MSQTSQPNEATRSEEKMFRPSQTDLRDMIKRADAKFAADRERCLHERFERANAINAQLKREKRQYNARRYINVGDTP